MGHPLFVVALAGPLFGQALLAADAPSAPRVREAPTVERLAELKAKDTDKISVITAGEEQKSSFDQCAATADVALCRILISVVNVAAIVGTSIPQ